MTFYQMSFGSASDLADYVNDQSIVQANIQTILEKDGRWYLFWWA